mmetsp:Transcript_1057/g.1658  ORF Transcript_1057/g.1658 Transcript_1057/m.1658 type:complete len:194 (-) Transcript_1057:205-786(-)
MWLQAENGTMRESQSMHHPSSSVDEDFFPSRGLSHKCLSPIRHIGRKRAVVSNANASWDLEKLDKPSRAFPSSSLKTDCLRLSLHSDISRTKTSTRHPASSPSLSSDSKPPKKKNRSSLKDDPEVSSLLRMLQTDSFVGEIDPVYHSRYIEDPEEDQLFLELMFHQTSSSSRLMRTSYNSDGHLLSRNISNRY